MSVLSKENFDLKQKFEFLNGGVQMLKANINELHSKIEELSDPLINKTQQLELNNFILQNLFLKKENEIFNLDKFVKNLKNYKKSRNGHFEVEMFINNYGDVIPVNGLNSKDNAIIPSSMKNLPINKEEDLVLKKILTEELEYFRGMYTKVTKNTIGQTSANHEINRKIEELQNEISWTKNPKPLYSVNNLSNLSEITSQMGLNTMPSSLKGKEFLKLNENVSHNTENMTKNEESLKQTLEELNGKHNFIQDLSVEVEQQKKINDKIEHEITSLNNELSENFSLIFKLEMKLEKLKIKRKKKKGLKIGVPYEHIGEENKKEVIR